MFFLKKSLYILCLAFLLFKKTKSFHFKVVNDLIYKKHEEEKPCRKEYYAYINKQLIQTCLYVDFSGPENINNILIKKIKHGNVWEKKYQLLEHDTTKLIRYFYTFSNDNKVVIIFCYHKSGFIVPYDCFYSTSHDGDNFETKKTSINYDIFDELSLTDYHLKPFEFFGEKYFMICGINIKRIIREDTKFFIICHASKDEGATWNLQLNFYYPNTSKYDSYFMVVPKINGNELGFLYFTVTHRFEAKYLKCNYLSNYDFGCHEVKLDRDGKILRDVTKIGGYYLTAQSNKRSSKCYLFYIYGTVLYISPETFKSEGINCYMPHFVQLDNSKFIYNYKNNMNNAYSYVFHHEGSVKHCTLMYVKKENVNPGFVKEGNDTYVCNIQYDEINVEGDDRYFVLSVLNEAKTDIKKCFSYTNDKLLLPINIVHKIDVLSEYEKYKLYVFHINRSLEDYFYFNKTLHCDLGDNFIVKLNLNFTNHFIVDNKRTDLPKSLNLYANNIIYYKIPGNGWKDKFLNTIDFPPRTKYIKISEFHYIYKLPSFIQDNMKTQLYFINKDNKGEKKEVFFQKGGKLPGIVGVDFSKSKDDYIYEHSSNECDKVNVEEDKVTVEICSKRDNHAILGIICPVDTTHQNVCFNEVFDNETKVFIRDFFKQEDNIFILPKVFVHVPKVQTVYEESILILGKKFLEKFFKNKSDFKDAFKCKCFANKKSYEITFKLK